MAAMWPETEAIAKEGLVAFACTSYKPMVAPAGAKKALFGTNPISFAWPRPGKLLLFMIWLQLQWQWERFKLPLEKVTKFLLELV